MVNLARFGLFCCASKVSTSVVWVLLSCSVSCSPSSCKLSANNKCAEPEPESESEMRVSGANRRRWPSSSVWLAAPVVQTLVPASGRIGSASALELVGRCDAVLCCPAPFWRRSRTADKWRQSDSTCLRCVGRLVFAPANCVALWAGADVASGAICASPARSAPAQLWPMT